MMTKEQLESVLADIKKQLSYEDDCRKAFGLLYPDSWAPVSTNYLWSALLRTLDTALGIEDFFSWWVFDTECGKDHAVIYFPDGREINIRTVDDIFEYVSMCNSDK